MTTGTDARTLAQLLAQRAPALAAELLPRGRRDGPEWRCGSLGGEPGQSLAVRITGGRAGVWSDFASGEKGDALDLVAAVLFRGDLAEAMRWSRRWLGLADGPAPRSAPAPRPPEAADRRDDPEDAETRAKRRASRHIFAEAVESIAGTGAALYLEQRGIFMQQLGRIPRALRFHPHLWCREAERHMPALLAAITALDGEHIATHRTYLTHREGVWRKAPLRDPKLTLGRYAGGCIRLWRGASGRPLAEAAPGETVAIGEGIETCLSVAIACPELRVLCAVSSGNIPRVQLPPAIGTVILCADNDGDNAKTAKALADAVARFTAEGREVRVARPPEGVKDFNDVLTSSEAAA